MTTLHGTWYDGMTSRAAAVTVHLDDDTLVVVGDGWERRASRASVRVSPRLAGVHRTLTFGDGAQVQATDDAVVDRWFPAANRIEASVHRLERRWSAAIAAVVIVIVSGWLLFAYGLPAAARHVATMIPPSVERVMGDEVYDLLDNLGFEASALPESRRVALTTRFDEFVARLPDRAAYELTFHAAPDIGPNAFALPGGRIVITDELVALLDDEQVLAVLAHEAGHQRHRHVLRSVLQNSAVVLIGALFTGDVSSAGAVVIAVPTFLLQSGYSRAFEEEADDYALAALAHNSITPARFGDAMRKLVEAEPEAGRDRGLGYLSSHPTGDARIEKAERAARAFARGIALPIP